MSPHHSPADSSVVRWHYDQPRRDAEEAQTEAAIEQPLRWVWSDRRVMSTVSESLSQLEVLVVDCPGDRCSSAWTPAGDWVDPRRDEDNCDAERGSSLFQTASAFRTPWPVSLASPNGWCKTASMRRSPGASSPAKPHHWVDSRRQPSFTSLDSSSRFSARWPAARFPSTSSARMASPGASYPICPAAACVPSPDISVTGSALCVAVPITWRPLHSVWRELGAGYFATKEFRLGARCRNGSPTAGARRRKRRGMADASGCATLSAECARHLPHAPDEWRRPVCRQGGFAASSGQ